MPAAFQTALMYGVALGPEGCFSGVLFQPGGQAECGQPPPACGRRVVHTERAGSSVDNPGTGAAGCPRPCGVGSWVVHTGELRDSGSGLVVLTLRSFSFSPPQGPPEAPRLSHVLMVQPSWRCPPSLTGCRSGRVFELGAAF